MAGLNRSIAEPTILLMAGEPSGDRHAAALVRTLRDRFPGARLLGTGGGAMRAEGVDLLAELDELTVMGFSEVVRRLPTLARVERRVRRTLDAERPDLVVLVDYPGLNMRIARAAKDRAIPVLYYIAPKVWATRSGRARHLARDVDRVASILPFEVDFLREEGVDARYVGNPLLDAPVDPPSRQAFCDRWGLEPSRRFIAFLPGSREQELKHHLGLCRDVARIVAARRPEVLPVFARSSSLPAGPFHDLGFPTVTEARLLLRHAEAAMVKSGTATLESAIEGTPLVVVYKTGRLAAWAARRMLQVEHVSLPNLVAEERIVPEFLQEEAVPSRIADALVDLLDDGEPRRRQLAGLEGVRELLGDPGATARVAALCVELLETRA